MPEPEKEMPTACLPTAIAAPDLAKTGKEKGSCLLPEPEPEPEKETEEKPLARLAPAIAPGDLANPVKKTRRPVPMTDEERKKTKHLKELHTLGLKGLQELREEHDDLRKVYDELLYRRRCLAARLVNRIVFQQRDAAYVRHQLHIGLKLGDKLPEKLKKARQPISMAIFMWREMGRAVKLGLDNFVAEYSDLEEYKKRTQREWNTRIAMATIEVNRLAGDSVTQK